MHTEVFNNIDLLVEMTGSKNNTDEISAELITLQRTIRNKKEQIEDLKSIMNDTRYFNASNELVDKNIEISLKNKIVRLERKIKEIRAEHETLNEKEQNLHEEISFLKTKLSKNEKYVTILTTKTNDSKNNFYKNILKEETENVSIIKNELDKKEKKYKDLLKEIELNNQAMEELENKLDIEKSRLEDITDSLKNPNAYIDVDLKKEDEDELARRKEELDLLEKRRIELLTDASVIATDAKQFIVDENYIGALSKIKELVTIVKSEPYMDITSINILEEELEKKEVERAEISNLIENKNYNGASSEAINTRISYLGAEISNNKKIMEKYEEEITSLDEETSNHLATVIHNLEKEIETKENTLEEYKNLLNKEATSTRTKSNLETAITKKTKEKKILDGLLVSYKENLLDNIAKTNSLSELINSFNSEIAKYEKELENLNKLKSLDLSTRDLIEEEKDKEKLRVINSEIDALNKRKRFELSADEIYDQIEMSLAEYTKKEEHKKIEEPKEVGIAIDNLFENKDNKIKVVEMIPVETVTSSDAGGN